MQPPIAVRRPAQRNVLDLVPQSHARLSGFMTPPKTVVSGSAQAGDLTESIHAGLRFGRFLDLLVDAVPALATPPRGSSLKPRKTFFKKSISMVCCPILRSSTAMRSLSSRAWGRAPLPGNASSLWHAIRPSTSQPFGNELILTGPLGHALARVQLAHAGDLQFTGIFLSYSYR